jgi:hypothetical protein
LARGGGAVSKVFREYPAGLQKVSSFRMFPESFPNISNPEISQSTEGNENPVVEHKGNVERGVRSAMLPRVTPQVSASNKIPRCSTPA